MLADTYEWLARGVRYRQPEGRRGAAERTKHIVPGEGHHNG